jgi:hypothetical protein
MKNLEYELNLNLDLLNNITWLEYKKDWLNLLLDWKIINTFADLENFAKYINIQYCNELVNFCKKQNYWK